MNVPEARATSTALRVSGVGVVRRLQKFNSTHKKYFPLHLKECEYRFNHRKDDLHAILLRELRKRPLTKREVRREVKVI